MELRRALLGIAAVTLAVQGAHAAFGFGGQTLADANSVLISISMLTAALALYEAKRLGGARAVRSFEHKGDALTWVERVREAIEEDRFVVYSQPIVDLKTGAVAREELLVRMQNDGGDVIPLA